MLLVAGAVLMLVAAVRLPSELRGSSAAPSSGQSSEPGAKASGPLCVGSPCRANGDQGAARGYEVPSIVVDPADPNHQVVGDVNLVGGHCGWHLTLDGGKSWADGVFEIPAGYSQCGLDTGGFMPMGNLAMAPGGQRLYVVFGSARPGEGEGILIARSTDGGHSFAAATVALPGGDQDHNYRNPHLTVVGDGQAPDQLLVSAWGCNARACTQGWFFRSVDGGATYSPPALVTPDPGGNSPSPAAMAADGTLYMTFLRRFGDDKPVELHLARSTNGGTSWESGLVDQQNGIGLQYDSAKVAVDPKTQAVYLLWADTRDYRPEIFFRRSIDKAATFEKAIRLHTSPGGSGYSPVMAVSTDGRIEVAFYRELRKNTLDVHATYSTDGGKTFAPDVKVNGKTIDRAIGYWAQVGDDATPAVTATDSAAYVAWSDSAEGTAKDDNQDTYVRRLDRKAGAPSVNS